MHRKGLELDDREESLAQRTLELNQQAEEVRTETKKLELLTHKYEDQVRIEYKVDRAAEQLSARLEQVKGKEQKLI